MWLKQALRVWYVWRQSTALENGTRLLTIFNYDSLYFDDSIRYLQNYVSRALENYSWPGTRKSLTQYAIIKRCQHWMWPSQVPPVTQWGKGSGAVRVNSIQKTQGDTRQLGWTKMRFITRHKPLEGVLLPESPPRVLRDPPFIHRLLTLSHTYIRTWCLAPFLAWLSRSV